MKKELLYEGKAKQIYATDKADEIIMHYKDDATAFNGVKKASIATKGKLNNKISTYIFKRLESEGIPTHLIEVLSEDEQLCKKIEIIPLEFICRNQAYGSMAKRLGMEKGIVFEKPVYEICYKEDALNDPLINDCHALALNIVSEEDLATCYELLAKVNELLITIFDELNITLVDFKIEFGLDSQGKVVLADEISPDSCRLLDKTTNEQLDKDLFRLDLGDITDAYGEIVRRIGEK